MKMHRRGKIAKSCRKGVVLAVIPARGGSKRLPRKNLSKVSARPLDFVSTDDRKVGSVTLLERTIDCAFGAKSLGIVIVSTDDPKIIKVAKKAGASVPFIRPAHLATDAASTWDVLRHALKWFRREKQHGGVDPEFVVCLQPTSPLRIPADIDGAVEMARKHKFDFVVSMSQSLQHPFWCFKKAKQHAAVPIFRKALQKSSQDLPELYIPNGAVYVVTPKWLDKGMNTYPKRVGLYPMPVERFVDVDTERDLRFAERLLAPKPN
jgi:CMP-N-acetylneuraminic acid synthetase